jgi:hypothetical protein
MNNNRVIMNNNRVILTICIIQMVRITLLDFFDTTEQKLRDAGHHSGPQCQCQECCKLLKTENKWILRLGTFIVNSGLNTKDEIKSKVRGVYRREGT